MDRTDMISMQSNQMMALLRELDTSLWLANEGNQRLNQELHAMRKTNARVKSTENLIFEPQKKISILVDYTDGTQKLEVLTDSVPSEYQITVMCFPSGYNNQAKRRICIRFANGVLVLAPYDFSENQLFAAFLEAGIVFNSRIPDGMVKKALFNYFVKEIQKAIEINMPILKEWVNGKLYISEENLLRRRRFYPQIPMIEKKIKMQEANKDDFRKYFRTINCIKDEKKRILFCILPFVAITEQLFSDYFKMRKAINFVTDDLCEMTEILPVFFQIYDRYELGCREVETSKRETVKEISRSCNEIQMWKYCKSCSQYENQAKCKEMKELVDYMTFQQLLPTPYKRNVNSVLMLITEEPMYDNPSVMNLSIGKNDFFRYDELKKVNLKNDVFAKVFFTFIRYVENHIQYIDWAKKKYEDGKNETENLFAANLYILTRFFRNYSFDIYEELYVKQEKLFDGFFEELSMFSDNMLEDFFIGWRETMPNISVINKKRNKISNLKTQTIVYDNSFIWVPREVFLHILEKRKLERKAIFVAAELKKAGYIKTDQKGYTRTLMFNGNRFETYQFYRDKLDEPGKVDFLAYGKEGNE